jgi:hypothetical protein
MLKVKLSLLFNQIPHHEDVSSVQAEHHAMKTYGRAEVELHTFLTLALDMLQL